MCIKHIKGKLPAALAKQLDMLLIDTVTDIDKSAENVPSGLFGKR